MISVIESYMNYTLKEMFMEIYTQYCIKNSDTYVVIYFILTWKTTYKIRKNIFRKVHIYEGVYRQK